MKKKHVTLILAALLSISLIGGILAGCSSQTSSGNDTTAAEDTQDTKTSEGGVITLKVNPEIAVSYNDDGVVTKVEGKNDDGETIVADYIDYFGKDCREVVSDLVAKINDAGYFAAKDDGTPREITLQIEAGSVLPEENFLKNIVADIEAYTSSQNLASPVTVNGESNYGWTNYGDTDYGPDNDGVTDYNDTDYGPNNDGVTDYNDTDYGPNNDGVTDYNDTDYGPNNDGVTDYNDTDYGANNDGVTDYSAPAPAPAPAPTPAPAAPSGGDSGYDDGDSGYDGGDSGYDGGDSGYDD